MKIQLNTKKFELMKICKDLQKIEKINLLNNWNSFLEKSNSEDVISQFKKNASLNNPETSEQFIEIINTLEKFLTLDDDISFKNVCFFIEPMLSGSKKMTLRPFRLISIMKKLINIAKTFEKEKNKNKKLNPALLSMKKDFLETIKEIKKRLSLLENVLITTKKEILESPEFSNNIDLEKQIKFNIKKNAIKVSSSFSSKSLANSIDSISKVVKNMSLPCKIATLENLDFGMGDDFNREIIKEILKNERNIQLHEKEGRTTSL